VSLLESTAVDLGTTGYDYYYGYGRVNAAAAVLAAAQATSRDTQPPIVSISSPTGGTVSGIVPVNVSASDNVGVTRVDLLVNGTLFASDTTTPYGFSWDSSSLGGSATLVARAYDAAGNSANSQTVTVTVGTAPPSTPDTTPPTVTINKPANGSTVSGTVGIAATAADNVGVASLSLYLDGVMKATGNVASLSWQWNTRKLASGTHTISAVAKDAAGNRTTATINVIK
jgi:archaellum component FlaF (FlaF/FlaG flagellin family)